MSKTGVDTIQQSYDDFPYASYPFPQTAPEHLQAVAWLFGLQAPEPTGARVLELGCAAGGNLVPFAARHAKASALGLDLSEVQIRDGQAVISEMGLENIELRQCDVSEVDAESLGRFDYIICHGVYSWVPEHVQQAILALCGELLTDNGVAYVSYNTYPGWKTREVVRDAMLLRAERGDSPGEKLSYARGMIDFLTQMAPKGSLLAGIMEENAPVLRDSRDGYLVHEFLETWNSPCYFRDFIARADGHGLAYLAESEVHRMFASNYPPEISGPLMRECGTQVMLEQYLDFLTQRQFRQTLLVRKPRAGAIRYNLEPERLRAMHYAAQMDCRDGQARLDDSPQRFGPADERFMTIANSYMKAAALALAAAWPATVDPAALDAAARERLGADAGDIPPHALDEFLEGLVIFGLARFRLHPVALAAASQTPRVDGAIRRRASASLAPELADHTFNAWHETVPLSPADRALIAHLDGNTDRAALIQALCAEVQAGRIVLLHKGKPVEGEAAIAGQAALHVDAFLGRLRELKLLV